MLVGETVFHGFLYLPMTANDVRRAEKKEGRRGWEREKGSENGICPFHKESDMGLL